MQCQGQCYNFAKTIVIVQRMLRKLSFTTLEQPTCNVALRHKRNVRALFQSCVATLKQCYENAQRKLPYATVMQRRSVTLIQHRMFAGLRCLVEWAC